MPYKGLICELILKLSRKKLALAERLLKRGRNIYNPLTGCIGLIPRWHLPSDLSITG